MIGKAKHKPDELLMDSIGFDEDDLAANRAGKLGHNQAARLKRLQQSARISGGAARGIGLFFVLGGLGLTASGFLGSIGLVIVGLMFLALGAQFFLRNGMWTLRAARAQLLDSQMNAVERIEGRVSLDVQTRSGFMGSSSSEYTVRLEGREWSVTREVFLAFKNGDPYALYYGPRSNVLLAAEWLREPPPGMDSPADDEDEERLNAQEKPKHGSLSR
jgi:hypothetical protein